MQSDEGAATHGRGEGQESGTEIVVADMTVSFKLVRETFSSRVTLDRPKLQILVEYLQGPFSHMQNRWTFRPLDDQACEVEFFIDYEFRSRTLGMMMGGMFDVAFRRFAAAFERAPTRFTGADLPDAQLAGRILAFPRESCSMASASNTDSCRTSARPMSPKRRSR